ncbi:unnamed protein product [Ambrosiozyma monospora]|uniref:Unnamed protein product n=1 Tax=Ambrosiozyma monospora TaxID=43982 RepID=A0ACB5U769_AMBMO|nr:unnamed protein product [Ambrosiozyma monospora]
MLERSFVLLPLCEILPPTFIHPVTAEPVHDHLKQLITGTRQVDPNVQTSIDLVNLVPLVDNSKEFRYIEYDLFNNKSKTQLMSILNVTPDSFSDGSSSNLIVENVMKRIDNMIANGVDIIDIGGCSTRPNSEQPSEEEELSRVLPVIKAARAKYPSSDDILISIDTYRSRVAEESIKAGADIINDVSAGLFDEKMYDVVTKYGTPYIINHLRGDISTMSKLTTYEETKDKDLQMANNS